MEQKHYEKSRDSSQKKQRSFIEKGRPKEKKKRNG
jgi:hypothetical protein